MDELREVLKTASDLKGLAHIGLAVDFSERKFSKMHIDDPLVAAEDARFREYTNLLFCIVRSRATSMLRHVLGLPEMLAGLVHSDPEKRDITWKKFQALVAAYRAALARQEPEVKAMVARCQLSTTALQWATKFAEATSWDSISTQMQEWLDTIFSSICQTLVLESTNRELRDKEQRGSTSKNFNKFDKWSRAVDTRILEKWGRQEIQALSCAPVPASFDGDEIFQPFHGKEGKKKDSVNLCGITGKADWVTYNTVSVLDVYAELVLLQHAHETNAWGELGGSWRSSFVPESQVISMDKSRLFLVVKALKGVVVAWPLVRAGPQAAQLQMDVSSLTFLPMLDIEDIYVVPTALRSPLRWHVEDSKRAFGLRWAIVGRPRTLMQWQAEQGFAHVAESSLKKMVQEQCEGMDEQLGECTDFKYAHKLALMLMMVHLPELTHEEAIAMLLRRSVNELKPETSFLEDVDDEAISDCVLVGDQKETKTILDDRVKAAAKKASEKASVQGLVSAFFPSAKQAAQHNLWKSRAARAAKKAAAEQSRLYAALKGDATAAIKRELPKSVKLVENAKNGRWLIQHADFKEKSFSWTQRGQVAASQLVLQTAWRWHHDTTGEPVPPHLEFGSGVGSCE